MAPIKKIKTLDGKPLLSARKAADRLHCAPDYIGKLCREGKLKGQLIDQAWFVEAESIDAFELARAARAAARAESLSTLRKQELTNNGFVPKKPAATLAVSGALLTVIKAAAASAAVGVALVGSVALTQALPIADHQPLGAAVAQIDSPFFGAHVPTAQNLTGGNFFSNWLASLFAPHTQPVATKTPIIQTPVAVLPPATTTVASKPTSTTIVQNTYPVIQRTIERVVASQGVSEDVLAQRLNELSNALTSKIYQISSQTSGNATVAYAPSQRIDQLQNVTITNATFNGVSGLTASDIPALNYFPATTSISVAYGGTGVTSYSTGDILYASGPGTLSKLPIGTTGQVLKVQGGLPVWGVSTGGSGGASAFATTSDNLAIVEADPTQVLVIGASATSSLGTIFEVTGNSRLVGGLTVTGLTMTTNLLATGSSTLQNFTALQSTSTNATSTNFFATTASSTNLFAQIASLGSLTLGSALGIGSGGTGLSTVAVAGVLVGNYAGTGYQQLATSSLGLLTTNVAEGSNLYYTDARSRAAFSSANNLLTYNSATGVFTASTTPTFALSTSTNATSTNFFATTASSTNLFAQAANVGSLAIANLSGFLKATAGSVSTALVNLTSDVTGVLGISNGGTGTSTAPSYGQVLVGNNLGGYDLVATSSLGITSSGGASYAFPLAGNATSTLTQFNAGLTAFSSSTIGSGVQTGGLTVSGGATTTGSAYFAGNVGIGTQSPTKNLQVVGTADITDGFSSLSVSNAGGVDLNYNGHEFFLGNNSFLNFSGTTVSSNLPYASSTALTATSLYATNFLATGSSTLQDFTALQSTSTNATSTNFFATTASSTNLFATAGTLGSLNGAGLSTCNSSTQKLLWAAGIFSCGTDLNTGGGGGTDVNWTFFNGSGIQVGTTSNQVLIGAASTSTLSQLEVHGGLFADNSTSTNATSTNFFATTASSTNLFAQAANVGSLAIANLSGFLKATAGSVSTALVNLTSDVTGVLPVANGGTATSTGGNINGVTYYDGSTLTNNAAFTFNGTKVTATYASSTALTATSLYATNFLATGSSTLQDFTALQSTSTNATSTNFFATTASSTNLFASNFSIANLSGLLKATNGVVSTAVAGTDYLASYDAWTHPSYGGSATTSLLTLTGGFISQASSTNVGNFTIVGNSTSTNATSTNFFATTASSTNLFGTIGNLSTLTVNGPTTLAGALTYGGVTASNAVTGTGNLVLSASPTFSGTATFSQLQANASTTLQNFTALNSTSTNATSTNFFATTASSTNLFAQAANVGSLAIANLSGFLKATAGAVSTALVNLTSDVTGVLPIANGGTNTNSQTTNGVAYFDGSKVTTGSSLTYNGTTLTAPYASSTALTATSLFATNAQIFGSSTIGDGTQTGGLAISGGATTTGNAYFAGNVGVGTNSPSSKLSIDYTFGGTAPLTISQSGTSVFNVDHGGTFTSNPTSAVTGGSLWNFGAGSGQVFGGGIAFDVNPFSIDSTSYLFRAAINNSTKFIIDNSGNVGIGTTSPYQKLSVAGNVIADAYIATSTTVVSSFQQLLANGSTTLQNFTALNSTSTNATSTNLFATTASSTNLFAAAATFGATTVRSGLTVTGNLTLNSVTGSTQCLHVDSSGVVTGTGTDCGASGGSSSTDWDFFNGSGTRLSTTTNQVLIGASATTTLGKLEVAGGNIEHYASGNPTLAFARASSDLTYQTAIAGNYAYIAENAGGLRIVDIRNPKSPTTAGSYTGFNTALSVAVAGKYAYVGDVTTGLNIIDISNPSSPTKVGNYSFPSLGTAVSANGIAVSGKYVYMTDYNNAAVRIVDVSNPAAPQWVGSYTISSGAPYGITVQGKYAYVADQGTNKIYVVDISNPVAPATVGSYTAAGIVPAGVYVSGKYLYVADTVKGFYVVDISNPASPSFAGQYKPDTTDAYYGLTVAGNYAYIADHGHLKTLVVDITDPTTPSLVGSYTVTNGAPMAVSVAGKYAYVSDYDGGLKVVDINGINTPAANIGSLAASQANVADNLTVGGDIAAGGGLDVGVSGIFSRGTIAAYIASTTQTNPVVASFVGGNVGVGTTTPWARLTIAAAAADANINTTLFAIASSTAAFATSTLFSISNTGAINTTGAITSTASTASTFPYASSTALTATSLYATNFLATGSSTLQNFTALNSTSTNATTTNSFATTASSTNLFSSVFQADGTTLAVDNVNHRVGVGTFSPSYKLDVAGFINTDQYSGFKQAGVTVLYASSTTGSLQLGSGAGNTTNVLAAYNTLVGFNAGTNITSGANNTILGSWSTGSNANLTTGSNNIQIGYNISLPSATNNNQLDIGNLLYGTGVNGSASTISTGALGVGSTTPNARLAVHLNGGDTNLNAFTIGSSTAAFATSTLFNIDNTGSAYFAGNVGLGTTSPFSKFSVAGGNITHVASGNPTLMGTYNTSGTAYSVTVSGKYAYVADGSSGLQIIDVSNPSSPSLVGTYNTSDTAQGVAVSGKYAYVADGSSGLNIIDVSKPSGPSLVGIYDTSTSASDVAVSGKYAYVTDATAGIDIIDISNPASPSLVGSYDTSSVAQGIAVFGKYAYVADVSSGLNIIDISNPAAPSLVGIYDTTGSANDVDVSGKYAYVADDSSGLQIINVSNPSSPSLVGTYNTSGTARGVTVSGKYAYVADDASGLQVIDISNPAAPSLVGTYDTSGTARGVTLSGKYAYVADDTSGLQVININGLETPAANIGSLETDVLNVTGNAMFGNDLSAQGGLNVGISGIFSRGGLGVYVASTTAANPIAASFMGGSVGIGTTSPWKALSISTTGSADGVVITNSAAGSGATFDLQSTDTGGNRWRFQSIGNAAGRIGNFEIADMSNGATPFVIQKTTENVGIGTTSPYANLSINAGAGQTSFAIGSSTSSYFVVNSVGNVGIGTTTPFTKLALTNGVTSGQVDIAYDNANYTLLSTNATGQYIIVPSSNTMILPNANEWICTGGTVSSNACPSGTPSGQGNLIVQNKIEIGTTTSSSKFDIETQDSTTNFVHVASTTNQNIFRINANGSVGIGTSTPFAKLTVGAGGAITTVENSLTDATTITVSWTDGNQQKVTLGGNRTINFTNYVAGQILRLVVCQDSTGNRTVTWDGAVLWQGAAAPTLTTTANYCDLVAFVASNATSTLKIFGSAALNFP